MACSTGPVLACLTRVLTPCAARVLKCSHSEGSDRSACCAAQAGQVESAVGLWRRMRTEGAQPSTDQCNALLTACLDCQHNERALRLFQEFQTMGKDWPLASTCCARVKLCIAG